jgi:hypothetical protein
MPLTDLINTFLQTTAVHGVAVAFLIAACVLFLWGFWIVLSGIARVTLIVIEGIADLFKAGKDTITSVKEEHKSFIAESKTNSARTAAAMELVSESTRHGDSKTHRALGHIATAYHMEAENPDVKRELSQAIHLLRDQA